MKNELEDIKDGTIEFYAAATKINALLPPVPAQQAMPEWWFKASGTVDKGQKDIGFPDGGTFKKCQPFTDAMRMGYIIPLWQDLSYGHANDSEDDPDIIINWGRGMYPYADTDPSRSGEMESPVGTRNWDGWKEIKGVEEGIYPNASFSFSYPWIIRTPPGYSCYFTSPANDEDPRIRLFTGVVHTDTYFNQVNFFFGIRKGAPLTGIMKKGMPLVQVIPFKREEWTLTTNTIEMDSPEFNHHMNVIYEMSTHIEGGYKKHHGCPVVFK